MDRTGSLKRVPNPSVRPLPPTPTPTQGSSRSSTPNSRSAFDVVPKPPSIAREKIKSKANATLDRMTMLQQRYRQSQENLRNGKGSESPNGRISASSVNINDQVCFDCQSPLSLILCHFLAICFVFSHFSHLINGHVHHPLHVLDREVCHQELIHPLILPQFRIIIHNFVISILTEVQPWEGM